MKYLQTLRLRITTMARKTTKNNSKNPTQEIVEAIDTPVNFQFHEIAEQLGIGEAQLRERLEAKTGQTEVHLMDTIPAEWEPHIKSIKIDLEAEASVCRLEAEKPVAESVESPILQEEHQPKKRRGRPKKSSTALTKKKAEAIEDNRQAATQTHEGIAEALAILQAHEGVQDGANAASAYLQGFVASLTNTKGEGLTTIAAEALEKIAAKKNFNPSEVVSKVGVVLSAQTQQYLSETMEEVLGKAQAATEEVMDTAWGNGYHVQDELSALDNLMNSNS